MTHIEPGSFITADDLQTALEKIGYRIKPYDIILLMTGADKYNKEKRYLTDYPGMSQEATLWLIEQGVKIIGIDAVGFDRAWKVMFEDYLKTKDK